MKAKLIKVNNIYTLMDGDKMIASSDSDFQTDYEVMKLSKENCDEIFEVIDVEKLACDECHIHIDAYKFIQTLKSGKSLNEIVFEAKVGGYIMGFNKAMELMGDNKFNDNHIVDAFMAGHLRGMNTDMGEDNTHPICSEYLNSLQQPTEIDVEIVMDICGDKVYAVPEPELNENGCLILKII